jgi:Flp pilus assembly protein TadB
MSTTLYVLVICLPAIGAALAYSWWHDRRRKRWARAAKARAAFLEQASDHQLGDPGH